MIPLPPTTDAYEHENAFYLTCAPGRVGKLLAHHTLYRMAMDLPGAYVECGVFKGASFTRFAMFRHLFESEDARTLVGFDTFGAFPETAFAEDQARRTRFIEGAGDQSISVEQLRSVLDRKECGRNVTLVPGDICETVPAFAREHPEFRIALLHLDVDIYEPSRAVMRTLAPLVVRGGVVILDDYGIFPGATKAVDDFLAEHPESLRKFPYALAPTYYVRGG